jgi:hypothetical protein
MQELVRTCRNSQAKSLTTVVPSFPPHSLQWPRCHIHYPLNPSHIRDPQILCFRICISWNWFCQIRIPYTHRWGAPLSDMHRDIYKKKKNYKIWLHAYPAIRHVHIWPLCMCISDFSTYPANTGMNLSWVEFGFHLGNLCCEWWKLHDGLSKYVCIIIVSY